MRVVAGQRPREDRRRGDGRRGRVREGPGADRQREAASVALRASTCSCSARSRRSSSSAAVFWFYGRERKTGYDREYEQEPPTDTAPALVPTLLRQGGEAGSFEFTATLFDLIRRGVFTSTPVTTERKTWGGLRSENVSDLELAAGQGRREADAVGERGRARRRGRDRGRPGAALELPRADRGRPDGDEQALHVVQGERRHRGRQPQVVHLARRRAARARPRSCSSALGALLVFLAADGWRSVYPRWNDVVLIGLAVAAFVNAAIVLGALTQRKLWRRRSQDGRGRGRALGGVPALPHRLPAPPGGAAGDARALGAAARLRDRVRDRRAGAAGGAHGDARGARRRRRRSTGSRTAAASAAAPRRWASATSPRASARRSPRRRPARAEAAAASRAAAAEAAAVAAAAPGRRCRVGSGGAPRELVERDRARRGDVERLRVARHRDRRDERRTRASSSSGSPARSAPSTIVTGGARSASASETVPVASSAT